MSFRNIYILGFLRKVVTTRYGPVGTRLSDSRDPMIIFADSSDPIFNSRNPSRVPKTP